MSRSVDELLDDQRRCWQQGEGRPVEQYLADHPRLAADDEGIVDLLYQEYVLRSTLGPPPSSDEFFHRFPRYTAELQAQLAFLHAAQEIGVNSSLLSVTTTRIPNNSAISSADVPPSHFTPRRPDVPRSVAAETGGKGWPCLEGYEILGEIGRGSMGVVYQAWHHHLRRHVALKMIHPTRAMEPQAQERFRSEAEAMARLQHPHIVQIYDVGEQDGRFYFAMEFVDGITLERRLANGPLPSRQAARLVEMLARAIHHAHARGVIHRDLKPANILLERDSPNSQVVGLNCPKITDFGLARQLDDQSGYPTDTGMIIGTPSYMAPEQATGRGRKIQRTADVYALGALLYALLTGRPPFLAETPLETLRQVESEEPLPPTRLQPKVPRDLGTVCLKCLEKGPNRRYESAEALADDLGRHLRGEAIWARPVGVLERFGRWCRRNPAVASLAVALVLVVAGAFAGIGDQWRRTEAAHRDAVAARYDAEASDSQTQQLFSEILQSTPLLPVQFDAVSRAPRIELLRKAETHSENSLRNRPGDSGLRIALTKVRGGLATLYLVRGQVAEADACLQAARGLWEPPALQDPHQHDSKVWLATANAWEGYLAGRRGQYVRAMRAYERAHLLWQDLTDEYPDDLVLGQQEAESYWCMLNLISTSPARKDTLPLLEENRVLLTSLVREAPSNTIHRNRLALTWLLLAETHQSDFEEPKAIPCWQRAHELYSRLAAERPDDLLVNLSLGRCCYRLLRDQLDDPYYREAVALYEKEGTRLATLVDQHPEADWLRDALLENYCTLALCHWQTGHATLGEQVIQDRVRRLIAQPREYTIRSTHDLSLLKTLIHLGIALREGHQREAALALAREAGVLADRYAMMPWHDLWFRHWLLSQTIPLAALLRQLGAPAEALRLAEQSRSLSQELCRTEPDNIWSFAELSETWTQIGKAHWDLHQGDKALAALREAAAVQRKVVDLAPSIRATRISLSRCYDRLFDRNRLLANWKDAAAALLEREKLWPDDAAELRSVALDFEDLANSLSMRPRPLSPEEQLERQSYFDQSARVMREADKAAVNK